ncbi:UDP-glucose 4-epimerase GalE [Peribacillus sp. NPDC097225]|uniref:UDP-glucose 4-epimerase GalE n=1 Tax=Peribacillus sp. NPDC097225 TaxID=3364400 RepID=UPI0038119CEC
MTILVTGGAGFIGSHISVELLNAGYNLMIVDNFSNSNPEVLRRIQKITGKSFEIHQIDLLNEKDLERVFIENRIEAVIHLAGLKAVGESVVEPLKYYRTNINSTINLCKLMKKYHVRKLVFSSSATVYGMPDKVPIAEDFPLKAMNPYGRTKLMIEEILQDIYISDKQWSISILRYFNPIGAHESGLIGDNPNGIPNNLMPFITKVAIGELKELKVFGQHYPTIDGTGVRDYIHVIDLAKGHVAALDKVLKTNSINTYNLGTGQGYSVLEIITAFESITGIKIPFQLSEPRLGDIAICYADSSKAKMELGWEAEKGIIEMCRDAWRWQRKNPNGYQDNKLISNSRIRDSGLMNMESTEEVEKNVVDEKTYT